MVRGLVGDRPDSVLLLEAADTVLEAGRAWDRPWPRKRVGVAFERPEGRFAAGTRRVRV